MKNVVILSLIGMTFISCTKKDTRPNLPESVSAREWDKLTEELNNRNKDRRKPEVALPQIDERMDIRQLYVEFESFCKQESWPKAKCEDLMQTLHKNFLAKAQVAAHDETVRNKKENDHLDAESKKAVALGYDSPVEDTTLNQNLAHSNSLSLCKLAEMGDLEALKQKITKENINASCPDEETGKDKGNTPLLSATKAKKKNIVEFLIEKGADPNIYDSSERTPLINAINDPEIVEILLKSGAKMQITQFTFGQKTLTPLDYAISEKLPSSIEILINHGLDMKFLNGFKENGLHRLAKFHFKDCGNEEEQNKCKERQIYLTKLFLSKGADPTQRDYEGNTPIAVAAEKGNDHLHETFIATGRPPGSLLANKDNLPPGNFALKYKIAPLIAPLIKNGSVYIKDDLGRDSLEFAMCNYDSVKMLIDNGYKVKKKSTYYLEKAQECNNFALFKLVKDAASKE